jgi:predicted site-specific integrase-resolvase
MPREINGQKYYTATEVCQEVAISRPTLFRWLKRGVLARLHKDRRGWRMFTKEDLKKIQLEANKIRLEELSSLVKR